MIGDQCGGQGDGSLVPPPEPKRDKGKGQGDGSLVPPPEPKCDKGTVLLSPLQNLNNHH